MDIATATTVRRDTVALTFVLGIHVIFTIGFIVGTVVSHTPPRPDGYKPRILDPELPQPRPVPPPPANRYTPQLPELPGFTLPVVQGQTTDGGIIVQRPLEQPSVTMATPVTAAQVAKGINLGDLCQAYYPSASRRLGEEGSVVVLIYVAASGRVTESRVETSSGVQRLDEAAQKCVTREGRFEPQKVGSDPVGSWQRMKYTWRLSS